MATTTAPDNLTAQARVTRSRARPAGSLFIPFCVAAMMLAAALSIVYAVAQGEPTGPSPAPAELEQPGRPEHRGP